MQFIAETVTHDRLGVTSQDATGSTAQRNYAVSWLPRYQAAEFSPQQYPVISVHLPLSATKRPIGMLPEWSIISRSTLLLFQCVPPEETSIFGNMSVCRSNDNESL